VNGDNPYFLGTKTNAASGRQEMSGPLEAVIVGKWSIGYADAHHMTILQFEFKDRAPVTFALRPDHAALLATAIQDQLKSPPRPKQMN